MEQSHCGIQGCKSLIWTPHLNMGTWSENVAVKLNCPVSSSYWDDLHSIAVAVHRVCPTATALLRYCCSFLPCLPPHSLWRWSLRCTLRFCGVHGCQGVSNLPISALLWPGGTFGGFRNGCPGWRLMYTRDRWLCPFASARTYMI